jgi:dethiobiotin synthetase
MTKTIVVTGTDTGVGKTALTALLARHARRLGANVAALKPIASGDRADAAWLVNAQDGHPDLSVINPWHFPAALSPLLAARRQHQCVPLPSLLRHLRQAKQEFDFLLVEGAGGLLSPLGEGFDTRTLIARLRAQAVVVCPNRLGAVGQARLVLAALPPAAAETAMIVLIHPSVRDASTESNAVLLAEYIGAERVLTFPWLSESQLRFQHPPSKEAYSALNTLYRRFLA